ncbi:MAG: Rne/Rng family ribonuclease [Planctomycetota bacterium]|jgi:ribonuclease E|nr:Rne/Rng family ribonuclease [Planctomycetota bacterium]
MMAEGMIMLVNAIEEEETRIALVKNGRLDDYYIERADRETLVGSIYKGKVENVHASLQAAFVNIGLPKNAFLHVSEVHLPGEVKPPPGRRNRGPRRPRRLIQNLLKVGDEIQVQVIRDAFGEKGPSVTMDISVAGRFLVLTPFTPKVGISKKIEHPRERAKLRQLIKNMKPADGDIGFIVRTASADTKEEDMRADLDYLVSIWKTVQNRAESAPSPSNLYQETDIVLRTIRDFFTPEIKKVVVDDPTVHGRLCEFFGKLMPRFRDRLQFKGGPTPIFHEYGIEDRIEQLHQKRVDLPSGGSLVMEVTEALTSIDVNSGRLVRESDPEELAIRTNREAAKEVMKQLRLRDVGGIIVIDFIDMRLEKHKREVEKVARGESARDRSQMVILPMSQFCLMQIARQKVRPSVQFFSHEPCPSCNGSGIIKNIASIGLEIVRELKNTLERQDVSVVEARVSREVADFLKSRMEEVQAAEERYKKRIHVSVGRDLPTNRVEFSCYSDTGEKVVDFVR